MTSNSDLTLDESRIRSILIRERYYRDTCQWKKMREMYHPDTSKTWVNITWYDGDIDGFISGSEKVTHDKVTTIHTITPNVIDIRGSKALAESFCTIISRFEHKGFEYDKITTCRLISRLEKSAPPKGSAWKLLTLEVIYIRDGIVSVAPQAADSIPSFEGVEKFPKAYRYGAWLLASIGIKSRDDLPQEDDRTSVKEVFDRNHEWLDAA